MSAPRFVPCRCGHSKVAHQVEGLAPQCTHPGCNCLNYRPNVSSRQAAEPRPAPITGGPLPPRAAEIVEAIDRAPAEKPNGDSIEMLLDKGRASELKPINRLADRIEALVTDLRERIADEAAAASVKAHIAKLEAQLTAAKAQLTKVAKGRRATPPAQGGAGHSCPEDACGRNFGTAQALGAHRARKHGYRRPEAS